MRFDIHYHTCNFGTRVMKRNRVTQKMQSVAVADTLTPAERKAVLGVLRNAGATRSDEFDGYDVNLPDGGSANVRPVEEKEAQEWAGLLVSVQVLTDGLARLLWDFCQAGNMAAVPVLKDQRNLVLVASEDCRMRAVARWSAPTVADSPEDFYRLLTNDSASRPTAQDGGNVTPSGPNMDLAGKACANEPRIQSRESGSPSPKGAVAIDLTIEAAEIREYIACRIADFDSSASYGPGEEATVKMVYAGFEFDQAGWFAIVFDRRADAGHDGEWTTFLDGNMLDRPAWAAAQQRNLQRPIRIRREDGRLHSLPAGTDFGPLLGRMLVGVLERAEREGVFDRLPRADGFRIGLEEFNGSFGWDSQTGFGGQLQ